MNSTTDVINSFSWSGQSGVYSLSSALTAAEVNIAETGGYFGIDPNGGTSGFLIGNKTLKTILNEVSSNAYVSAYTSAYTDACRDARKGTGTNSLVAGQSVTASG